LHALLSFALHVLYCIAHSPLVPKPIVQAQTAVCIPADNNNFTWTLLNSWGSGNDKGNTRTAGITADGLFKVQLIMTALSPCFTLLPY
jgi:hypothetical protein